MIDEFILQIRAFFSTVPNSSLLIKDLNLLIEALTELNSVIGLNDVKEMIVSQIKCICASFLLKKDVNIVNNDFLHMVFSGPPGIGKTTLAHIICKIMSSLGILSHKKKKESIVDKITLPRENKFLTEKLDILEKDISTSLKKIESALLLEKNYKVIEYLRDAKINLTNVKESIPRIKFISRIGEINFDKPSQPPPKTNYRVYKRSDLVGQFLGETAIKTQKALEEGLGGVILIDEAYELYSSSEREDMYGMECLSTINKFMSEHCNDVIIIFVGYMDLLNSTIFRVQPGLRRRIGWIFEFEPYSFKELKDIFISQFLKKGGWEISDDEELLSFFRKNLEAFPNYGGDTQRLVTTLRRIHLETSFNSILSGKNFSNRVHIETLEKALVELKNNNDKVTREKTSTPPEGMYS